MRINNIVNIAAEIMKPNISMLESKSVPVRPGVINWINSVTAANKRPWETFIIIESLRFFLSINK